jgi:hypothetical protein
MDTELEQGPHAERALGVKGHVWGLLNPESPPSNPCLEPGCKKDWIEESWVTHPK